MRHLVKGSWLALGLATLLLNTGAAAENTTSEMYYRFPETQNPNPIAGRLFLQPIGDHDDQVIEGLRVDGWALSYSEYNRRFQDGTYGQDVQVDPNRTGTPVPNLLFMNGNSFQLSIAKGFRVRGFKLEAGGIVRTHLDRGENSEMQVFLAWFHQAVAPSPGHIPLANQSRSGVIGERKTVIIGNSGEFYVTSAELYAKMQLLEEKTYLPNVSVKLVTRIPLSGLPFDTFGAGLSLGISKEIFNWLTLIGAASISYQNIHPGDFNATNLKISPWSTSLFGGVVLDPGKKGGFYMTAGFRYSSVRVTYATNPGAAYSSRVLHASFNYREKSGRYETYIFADEEVPHMDNALEPDFVFGVGMSYYGKNDAVPARHE